MKKGGRRSTRATVGRKMDGGRQVGKRKGSTINMEGTQSTRLRLVGKRIRSSIKIEWIPLCSHRFPKPRLRLETERVEVRALVEKLLDFLSRSDGAAALIRKTQTEGTQFQSRFRSRPPSFHSAHSSWPNYSSAIPNSFPTATALFLELCPAEFRSSPPKS